jgi:hypothetical protein
MLEVQGKNSREKRNLVEKYLRYLRVDTPQTVGEHETTSEERRSGWLVGSYEN